MSECENTVILDKKKSKKSDPELDNKYDYVNTSVVNLKKICKRLHITNYSIMKKNELRNEIYKYFSIVKIQKSFRKYFSSEEICPISIEPIKYPCFPFKPKGATKFIYYNLEPLIEYLITTGDFRDPKTREKYSSDTLRTLFFNSYTIYFRRLIEQSRDRAEIVIERTISLINETVDRMVSDSDELDQFKQELIKETNSLRDNIILFLYQLKFDELELDKMKLKTSSE